MACFLQCLRIPGNLDIDFKITNHINITKGSLKALPFGGNRFKRMDFYNLLESKISLMFFYPDK